MTLRALLEFNQFSVNGYKVGVLYCKIKELQEKDGEVTIKSLRPSKIGDPKDDGKDEKWMEPLRTLETDGFIKIDNGVVTIIAKMTGENNQCAV